MECGRLTRAVCRPLSMDMEDDTKAKGNDTRPREDIIADRIWMEMVVKGLEDVNWSKPLTLPQIQEIAREAEDLWPEPAKLSDLEKPK